MVRLSFTFPLALSLFRFLPVALISTETAPVETALLITAIPADMAPGPDAVSSPGFGTFTASVAVPLFLLRLIPPTVKVLVGSTTALRLRRAPLLRLKSANPPSTRFGVCEPLTPWPLNPQPMLTDPDSPDSPSTSPARTATLAGKLVTVLATTGWGPSCATNWYFAGSPILRNTFSVTI